MKVNFTDDVVWKNVVKRSKRGTETTQEIEAVGKNLVRQLTIEEIVPNKWYLMRPNGKGNQYRPVFLSENVDYKDIKAFIKHGMLYEKLH